jgi:hypothetical protein
MRARQSRAVEINAIVADCYSLLAKERELLRASRDATIGTHDAVPRDVFVASVFTDPMLCEYTPDQTRRVGIDITVGPHEPLWDRADPLDDLLGTGVGARGHEPGGAITRRLMRSPTTLKSYARSAVPPGKLPLRRHVTT